VKLAEFKDLDQQTPWVLPVEHLSASSLGMLQRCPEQFRQRYILGRKMRPGVGLVLGSACHTTTGHNFAQKVTSGVDVPVTEMEQFFSDQAWPAAVSDNGGVDEILWKERSADQTRAVGEGMISLYHGQVSPRIQPEAIETKFSIALPLVPVPVIGYVDLLVKDGPVVDLKTSSKRVKSVQGKWETQNRLYKLFTGRAADWHILASTKTPSVTTPLEEPALRSEHSSDQDVETIRNVQRLAWLANALLTKFGPDDPWPTTGVFNEHCGWCGFRPVCTAWKGG